MRRVDSLLLLLFPDQKALISAISFTFKCIHHSLHSVEVLKNEQRRIELFFWTMKSAVVVEQERD